MYRYGQLFVNVVLQFIMLENQGFQTRQQTLNCNVSKHTSPMLSHLPTPRNKFLKFFRVLILLQASIGLVHGQFITHGPVTGAVGPDSARIFIRTVFAQPFTLEYATDSSFTQGLQTISSATDGQLDNSKILTLRGLNSSTRYFLRFNFGGTLDNFRGSFKTFPAPGQVGDYVITAGSCQETANMNVFLEIPRHNPDLFIHLGDWTYPAYQLSDNYPEERSLVEESWRRRYAEINMREMMHHLPVDYIYDDDDFTEGGSTRNHHVPQIIDSTVFLQTYHRIVEVFIPDSVRRNVVKGYMDFFPHYPLVDTSEGVFHRFTLGNAEIFFLDTRATASPPSATLYRDPQSALYSFAPSPDNTLLRQRQMDWLLDGLQNSTADWKIICMGNVFNQSERRYIDFGLQNQLLNIPSIGSPFSFATAFSNNWSGYPGDSRRLLRHLDSLQIKDVFVLSGQSHNNVVDDGTNAGLPELNASGLSVADRSLSNQMQNLSLFGLPDILDSLWNGGGNGLGNSNLNNGFGKVQIFGRDSARLSAVDEFGETLGSVLLLHSSSLTSNAPETVLLPWALVPNPASQMTEIHLTALRPKLRYQIVSMLGAVVAEGPVNQMKVPIDLESLENGLYQVVLSGPGTWQVLPLAIQNTH